jgi:TonB family protein
MRPMRMVRRLGPWAASAVIHAAAGAVAFLAVAGISSTPTPDPDATYAVAIRPGGEARISDAPRLGELSYGVPEDTVTVDETPLTGVPDLPLTSGTAVEATKPGTGLPPRAIQHGPVVKFTPQGAGRPVSTGRGVGTEGRDEGVEAVPLETPSPAYPDAARRKNLQGAVIAEIRIDREGKVESARAAEGSGSPLLDDAALAAVRAWKYRPATLGGKPVPSVRRVRFVFRLE